MQEEGLRLPVRILDAPPPEPVLLVDGVFDAPGLNLSHWPGHRTPQALRHDLSTGSVLAFARLPEDERTRLASGCTAIANNHYDTDGTCALFAARFPHLALPRADRLLACARAGDFFQLPDLDAYRIDLIVAGLATAPSPLHTELANQPNLARWQRQTDYLLEHFPALLDGDLAPLRDLWAPGIARLEEDLAELSRARRTDAPRLDLTVYEGGPNLRPGRHALHGSSDSDRILVLASSTEGLLVRLLFSTLSWFDLVSAPRLPRPSLEALTARLNELEGTTDAEVRWRTHPTGGAAPELWFGAEGVAKYAEHNEGLAASGLGREVVLGVLR
ncbi:MAG: DUF6687 family protein, partial [Planctomycetota bacterium]